MSNNRNKSGRYQLSLIAEEKGLTASGTAEKILAVLKTYGLPYESKLPLGDLTEAISLDKKNLDNHLNLVLLKDIGDSYVYPASIEFFAESGRMV